MPAVLSVAELLDRYMTDYVLAEGLRDPVTVAGRLKAVKTVIGRLPATALEKPPAIQRFKAAYRQGRAVATFIGALETCCRKGEMLRIQNRHVDWERHQLVIPGANAKDGDNRRVPFDPQGRLAPILRGRAALGPTAYVFGGPRGRPCGGGISGVNPLKATRSPPRIVTQLSVTDFAA